MHLNNIPANDPASIAELFSTHFKSIYHPSSDIITSHCSSLVAESCDEKGIKNIKNLNSNQSSSCLSNIEIKYDDIKMALKSFDSKYPSTLLLIRSVHRKFTKIIIDS